MAKLTQPQHELLEELAYSDEPVVTSYPPAKALVKQGLAVWKDAMFCDVLSFTEAGRAYLNQPEEQP